MPPRITGLETELAIQFFPTRPGDATPTHEAVFRALLAALKTRFRSCEALYYKGGEFLENGSLVHFEVGRLELSLGEIRRLAPGAVLPLMRPLDEALDIVANGRRIGSGTIVRIGDAVGVRVTRLLENA